MKKIFSWIACISLCLIHAGTCFANNVTNTTVKVNETDIIKPSDRRMLGINDNWYNRLILESDSTQLSKEYYEAVKDVQLPMVFLRMAGGESQDFYWKDNLGTVNDRGYLGNSGVRADLGIVEWLKYTMQMNKNAKFNFCVNVNDTLKNNADLVRFLCLQPWDKNAIDEDGINWAQKRVEYGIIEPVDVVFELGNEYDLHRGETDEGLYNTANEYIDLCRTNISAMKSIKSDIRYSVLMYTLPHVSSADARKWNSKIISELGADADYVTYHYYYHGNSNSTMLNYRIPEITDYINELPQEQRPKIFFSEHAVWTSFDYSEEHRKSVTALSGALKVGFVINQAANIDAVEMMTYHCMISGTRSLEEHNLWGLIARYSDDGKFYASGVAEMLKTFNYAYGDGNDGENIVRTTLEGEDEYINPQKGRGLLSVSSHTTKDGGLNIILLNNEESAVGHNLTFEFKNKYRLDRAYILDSDNIMADNNPLTPDGLYCKCEISSNSESFTSYYVPPTGAVVLKLVPSDAPVESEKDVELEMEYAKKDDSGTYQAVLNDGKLSFYGRAFDNKVSNAENAALTIIQKDTSVSSGMVFVDNKAFKRNIVHFDAAMPADAEEGMYTAILSAKGKEWSASDSIDFYYTPCNKSRYIQNVYVHGERQNGIAVVNNENYEAVVSVGFTTDFPEGEKYSVTVTSDSLEYAPKTLVKCVYTHGEAQTEELTLRLPEDALGGRYSVSVSCDDGTETAEFILKKPTERIILTDVVRDEYGNELTRENIANVKNAVVKIDMTEQIYDNMLVLAVYDKDGSLLSCSVLNGNNQEYRFNLNVPDNKTADTVKLYVFEKNNQVPQIEVYHIK